MKRRWPKARADRTEVRNRERLVGWKRALDAARTIVDSEKHLDSSLHFEQRGRRSPRHPIRQTAKSQLILERRATRGFPVPLAASGVTVELQRSLGDLGHSRNLLQPRLHVMGLYFIKQRVPFGPVCFVGSA